MATPAPAPARPPGAFSTGHREPLATWLATGSDVAACGLVPALLVVAWSPGMATVSRFGARDANVAAVKRGPGSSGAAPTNRAFCGQTWSEPVTSKAGLAWPGLAGGLAKWSMNRFSRLVAPGVSAGLPGSRFRSPPG